MSYHRDWEWDDPQGSRQVTIKRYVIPDEQDSYPERGMVVRRHERYSDYDGQYPRPKRNCQHSQSVETLGVEPPDGTKE